MRIWLEKLDGIGIIPEQGNPKSPVKLGCAERKRRIRLQSLGVQPSLHLTLSAGNV